MKKVLLLVLTISLFSCSNSESTAPIAPIATNSIAYFKASLNGQPLNYTQTNYVSPTHYYGTSSGYSGIGFDKSHYYGSYILPYPGNDGYPQIDLTFHNMYQTTDTNTETAAFYGLFSTIPSNFISFSDDDNWIKGISVNYQSQDGTRYSTLAGSQTGSTMAVFSSTSGIAAGGFLQIKTISGNLNCKLYNENDPLDVIVLTNGKYKLIFQEFD